MKFSALTCIHTHTLIHVYLHARTVNRTQSIFNCDCWARIATTTCKCGWRCMCCIIKLHYWCCCCSCCRRCCCNSDIATFDGEDDEGDDSTTTLLTVCQLPIWGSRWIWGEAVNMAENAKRREERKWAYECNSLGVRACSEVCLHGGEVEGEMKC